MFHKTLFKILLLLQVLGVPLSSAWPVPQSDRFYFPDEVSSGGEENLDSRILEPKQKVRSFMPEIAKAATGGNDELIVNPELENGKHFQGDMILQPDQEEFFKANVSDKDILASRTGILHESYRWPKDRQGHVNVAFKVADLQYSECFGF